MSRTRIATLGANRLPDAALLNRALKAQRLKLSVDSEWGDVEHNGYVPCALEGEDAGFELRRSTGTDGQPVLVFRWGGDRREQAAALAVLSVLASQFGAEVTDPELRESYAPDQLTRLAEQLMREATEA